MLYKRQANKFYTLALIIAWVATITSFALTWRYYYWSYVLHNTFPYYGPWTTHYVVNQSFYLSVYVPQMVADCIMVPFLIQTVFIELFSWPQLFQIWRFYIMWTNKWILIVLIILSLTSTGKSFTTQYLNQLYMFIIVCFIWSLFDRDIHLLYVAYLGSATITLVATFLIVIKIRAVSHRSHIQNSYSKIVKILIQSAAANSFVLVIDASSIIIATTWHICWNSGPSGLMVVLIWNYSDAACTLIGVSEWSYYM